MLGPHGVQRTGRSVVRAELSQCCRLHINNGDARSVLGRECAHVQKPACDSSERRRLYRHQRVDGVGLTRRRERADDLLPTALESARLGSALR